MISKVHDTILILSQFIFSQFHRIIRKKKIRVLDNQIKKKHLYFKTLLTNINFYYTYLLKQVFGHIKKYLLLFDFF